MATMTEEERRKKRLGIGSISPADQQRFDKTAQTGREVIEKGKGVVNDISRAFSAAPAVAADYSSNRGDISKTITARQDPRKSIMESAGRPQRGFGGMADMPNKPKSGEAQAATLTDSPVTPVSNPVQDIAATQKKRTFPPQQKPQQGIAKPSQFGGQFRPVPQRAGGGQMIEWYKDGEDPGYSYVDTPEAAAFNDARDREFGPMQVAPEDQLKKQLLTATPEQSKGIEQKLATMEGRTQQQSLTPGKVAEMEANVNEGYNAHFSNAAMPQNPADYLDADMKKPIDKKFWLYKNSPATARTLYGAPDAETEALLSINAYPDQWQSYLNKAEGEKQNVLARIINEMMGR